MNGFKKLNHYVYHGDKFYLDMDDDKLSFQIYNDKWITVVEESYKFQLTDLVRVANEILEAVHLVRKDTKNETD